MSTLHKPVKPENFSKHSLYGLQVSNCKPAAFNCELHKTIILLHSQVLSKVS